MERQPSHIVRNARSFIMHQDIIRMSSQLNDEELGRLVRHFYHYAENGQTPDEEQNLAVNVIFNEWRLHFEYDKERYEAVIRKRSEAGQKRWKKSIDMQAMGEKTETEPNLEKKENETPTKVEAKKKTTASNSRTLEDRKNDFYQSILPYTDQYDREMLNDFYQYWTELDKRRRHMRFEMQKTWETSKRLSTWSRREKSIKNSLA